jgi:hypothetical protein
MADNKYDFYGSAAYDVRGTAVPRPRPARLPEEKPHPQAKQAPKPRLTIAPLAVVGLVVVAALLLMVVYSYVQLYEATDRAGELTKQLSTAQAATGKLRSTYESRIDLAEIEARARELGMAQPSARQTVYLNIAGADHAEVLQVDRRGFAEKAWDAVKESFNGVLEYFR